MLFSTSKRSFSPKHLPSALCDIKLSTSASWLNGPLTTISTGNCHLPAPVQPSWLGTQRHRPSPVRGDYSITGLYSGHALGQIWTRTSGPSGLNPFAKGYQQHAFFLALVATLDPLPVPILVRNLEDLSCPPARLLIPGERVLKKIAAYLEWIHDHHLGWPASPVHWTLVVDLLIVNFYLWTFLSFLCFFRRGRLNLRWEKC